MPQSLVPRLQPGNAFPRGSCLVASANNAKAPSTPTALHQSPDSRKRNLGSRNQANKRPERVSQEGRPTRPFFGQGRELTFPCRVTFARQTIPSRRRPTKGLVGLLWLKLHRLLPQSGPRRKPGLSRPGYEPQSGHRSSAGTADLLARKGARRLPGTSVPGSHNTTNLLRPEGERDLNLAARSNSPAIPGQS